MLRESPSYNWYRTGVRALFAAFLITFVGGCSNDERHHISVQELRSHHEKYIGKRVVLKGYLSGRFEKAHGYPYLFATADDATMRNHAAGVFIDLYENPWVKDINECMEHFVQVWGRFRVIDNPHNRGLAVAGIEALRILPPGDAGFDEYCVGPAPADWETQE